MAADSAATPPAQPPSTPPIPAAPPPPAPATSRRAIHRIARPGLTQAVIAIGRPVDLADDDLAVRVAAVIVQSVLGERLRGDMAATYGVEVTLEPARGPGLLRVLTEVDAAAIGPALTAIQRALAELQRLRPGPELVARICVHEALDRLYQTQTDQGQQAALARALSSLDRPPRVLHPLLAAVLAVTGFAILEAHRMPSGSTPDAIGARLFHRTGGSLQLIALSLGALFATAAVSRLRRDGLLDHLHLAGATGPSLALSLSLRSAAQSAALTALASPMLGLSLFYGGVPVAVLASALSSSLACAALGATVGVAVASSVETDKATITSCPGTQFAGVAKGTPSVA